MKTVLTSLFLLVLVFPAAAQNTRNNMYKQYAGRYGSSEGICLFEDGRFMLYGYATAVFGKYVVEKDQLLFSPDQRPLFEVYATHNTSIGNSMRVNFAGFDGSHSSFVRFGKDSVHRVFNEDANCFDAPFVYELPAKVSEFTLGDAMEEQYWNKGAASNTWQYSNQEGYNDFIFAYNAPAREYQDFRGVITRSEDGEAIQLSNYGGEHGYFKNKQDEGELQQWKEILAMKKEAEEGVKKVANGVYANEHYHIFLRDLQHYTFNREANQYISKDAAANAAYFRDNQYNDDRYLRHYTKLLPTTKNTKGFNVNEIAGTSIFFTVCGEGSEKSYHYKGIKRDPEANDDGPIPTTTAPVPIP